MVSWPLSGHISASLKAGTPRKEVEGGKRRTMNPDKDHCSLGSVFFFSGLEKIGYIGHKIVQGDKKKRSGFSLQFESYN